MSMEEIEKLRTRVEKDPNSRLFLPLAEEYRKTGMLDEAISVILKGLESQPGYTSARVALGRIYLEKNMIEEAKNEFEAVVATIPDNLFAHRKLADIYKEQGETEKAIAQYKTVIRLNPLDEDAKMCLSEIEGLAVEKEPVGPEDVEISEVGPAEVSSGGEEEAGLEVVAEAEAGEGSNQDFEAFKNSFSAAEIEDTELDEEVGEVVEIPDDQSFEIQDEASFGDVMAEAPSAEKEIPKSPEAASSVEAAGISAADSFVAEGNYYRAMETYRKILADDPGNRQVLQRVAELKTLMTLTGRGNEALIAKLEEFLDGVRKGFPRRS